MKRPEPCWMTAKERKDCRLLGKCSPRLCKMKVWPCNFVWDSIRGTLEAMGCLMTSWYRRDAYLGHSMPERIEPLVSIIETHDNCRCFFMLKPIQTLYFNQHQHQWIWLWLCYFLLWVYVEHTLTRPCGSINKGVRLRSFIIVVIIAAFSR